MPSALATAIPVRVAGTDPQHPAAHSLLFHQIPDGIKPRVCGHGGLAPRLRQRPAAPSVQWNGSAALRHGGSLRDVGEESANGIPCTKTKTIVNRGLQTPLSQHGHRPTDHQASGAAAIEIEGIPSPICLRQFRRFPAGLAQHCPPLKQLSSQSWDARFAADHRADGAPCC